MRLDPAQVAALINQQDPGSPRRSSLPATTKSSEASLVRQQAKTPPAAIPAPKQMSVSIDSDQNVIYQFMDAQTGEVVQQVPPEQVLRVMRSIADLLREAEQKVNISI